MERNNIKKYNLKDWCLENNSIGTKLLSEWDYEKNDVSPEDVTPKTSKKVWWKCSCGHSWETRVSHRVNGSNCPFCSRDLNTSFPEQVLFYYVKQIFPDAVNGFTATWLKGAKGGKTEIDVFVPSLNVGIEYDGDEYHKNVEKDIYKDKIIAEHGILLIRIREPLCPKIESCSICINIDSTSFPYYYEDAITKTLNYIKDYFNLDYGVFVNVRNDLTNINNSYNHSIAKKSIAETDPQILQYWDYERNGNMRPESVKRGSEKLAFWVCCKCNYKWESKIKDFIKSQRCPRCSGSIIVKGENDLAYCYPELLKEWDFEKNGDPEKYFSNSNKRVWWKCHICGYEWQTSIANRTYKNSKCPACINRVRVEGKNDLETLYPETMLDWDYEKNSINFSPTNVSVTQKVWWKCHICGYEWQNSINQQCYRKHKCLNCAKLLAIPGKDDLASRCPELLKYWDFDKNKILPTEIKSTSTKLVWWKNEICGREWQESVINQIKQIDNSSKKIHESDLLIKQFPDLVDEWDYKKNKIPIEKITVGSGKKVWWKCKNCGNEWEAVVRTRTTGCGCPKCNKRRGLVKFQKTTIEKNGSFYDWCIENGEVGEKLLKEWADSDVSPKDIPKTYKTKIKWKCSVCKYEWLDLTEHRMAGRGCQKCTGRKLIKGINDLATTRPDLLEDWDYEKNTLNPMEIKPGSTFEAFWKCHICGYEWKSSIRTRSRGFSKCPNCTKP